MDPFGHPTFVYAIGNPEDYTRSADRYERAQKRSSGYGVIRFDTENRTITAEAYTFLADHSDGDSQSGQFPGWPHTINQTENNGRNIAWKLKEIQLNPEKEYVQVISEKTGKLEYSIRPKESSFIPWAYSKGTFIVRIINEETGEAREAKGQTIR